MSDKFPYQTLHCHTTTSDGLLGHEQVLDKCAENKIGVVAFTDHDAVPKPEIIEKISKLNHPTRFLCGIEISANYVKEVEGQIGNFHIVGLFVDPTNQKLLDYCKLAQEKRIERAERIVKNIQALGFNITMEDINFFSGGETVGRPHIAKAILSKEENLKVIDSLMLKVKSDLGEDQFLQLLYQHASSGDYWQKIFDLFLDSRSIIKGVYVHYLNPTSLDDASQIIRQAGGVSVLAHWTFYKNKISAELVEKFCKEKRLDGLETVYALDMPVEEKPNFLADMEYLKSLVNKYNMISGGGGDFHRPEDFKLMVDPNYSDYAQATKGMVEKIIERYPKINREWDNL